MAEGWAKHLKGNVIDAYSAGTHRHGMNQVAVEVMLDAGVDISTHSSKTLDRLAHVQFDLVVTVCDNASETCPVFTGAPHILHRSFDDPPRLAQSATHDDEAQDHYRRVCDEIREFVNTLPDTLEGWSK
jgi:arsenate reductase